MKNLIVIVVLLSGAVGAQELPQAPKPKGSLKLQVAAQVAMWGSSFVLADSAAHGTGNCVNELARSARLDALFTSSGGGVRHPYEKTLAVALPLDAGVSLVSIWLRRKHHPTLALWLPSVSMGVQAGAAAIQYGAGCT